MTSTKHAEIKDLISNNDFSNNEESIKYLCSLKNNLNLTWEEIADLSSEFFGTTQKEGHFRKKYGEFVKLTSSVNELDAKLLELKKEKVKLADERIQNNAYVRKLAREDTIKEIAANFAEKMNSKKILDTPSLTPVNLEVKSTDAILCISDWHYGIEINNFANKYNPEIARQRIAQLRDEVIKNCLCNNVETLHIMNLADLIAGRIHLQLRLASRFDVITQIMEVSEILAEFITDFTQYFNVEYYSCLDNHSRLEPNKNESIDLESLCRITDWYLVDRLKSNPRFHINQNEYGEDIISFTCRGHIIGGSHGNYDRVSTAVFKLNSFTHNDYDMICLAHRHHYAAEEECRTLLICNGSIMGTDSYAHQLRLDSKPSQNLIIVSDERVMQAFYRIELD